VPDRARSESAIREVEKLVHEKRELLDGDADHFTLLGLTSAATPDQIRAAYFALARQIHPDRLASLGYEDAEREAHRVNAELNTAFAVLSDAKRRKDYVALLQRGGETVVAQEQAKADDTAKKAVAAEQAFRRGEMAMRRDQIPTAIEEFRKAIELKGDEPDYHAMLAWAQFCAAPDKAAVASDTRNALEKAISRSSPKHVTAHFYLGRVERMLGRDQDALRHFMDVLSIAANHTEARSEIRAIQARIASAPAEKSKGLFGRTKPNSKPNPRR
jgi:curved DNA-binding protein CbpA